MVLILFISDSVVLQGEPQTPEHRLPVFISESDQEFTMYTENDQTAVNIGEIEVFYTLDPQSPTFMGLPLDGLPSGVLAERFFQKFHEVIAPCVTADQPSRLRPLILGILTGDPKRLEMNKIKEVCICEFLLLVNIIIDH